MRKHSMENIESLQGDLRVNETSQRTHLELVGLFRERLR